jgi:hypothetical protein
LDKRRNKILKEKRNNKKKLFEQESSKLFVLFLIFVLFGLANWMFWEEQFLNLDYRYYLIFQIIPIGFGVVYFNLKFKQYFDYNTKSKFSIYTIILYLFYGVFSLMLSYASFGTASNVAFKSLMYFSTKEVKSQTNKYKITNIYNPLQHRRTRRELRRFHFEKNFNIDYQVGVNQNNRINISIYDPENNYLLDLDKQEVINKTLVLETKKGFWGIEKVEKIVVE